MLTLSSLPTKRHMKYSVGVSFFSGYFSTNIVRVLPFTPLKVFSFQSWKSMMCVRRLFKKAVAFEVQIMRPVKESSQSSSHLMLTCDPRAHQV